MRICDLILYILIIIVDDNRGGEITHSITKKKCHRLLENKSTLDSLKNAPDNHENKNTPRPSKIKLM